MKIVMVGSVTHAEEHVVWGEKLMIAGHIVVPELLPSRNLLPDEIETVNLGRLGAIADADAVFVLDVSVGGERFLGERVKREIAWARLRGKAVFWFSNGGGARLIGPFAAVRLGETALQPDSGLASVSRETRAARAAGITEALSGRAQEAAAQEREADAMLAAALNHGVGELAEAILPPCPSLQAITAPSALSAAAPSRAAVAAAGDVRAGE